MDEIHLLGQQKAFLHDTNLPVFSLRCLIPFEPQKADMLQQFGAQISAPRREATSETAL